MATKKDLVEAYSFSRRRLVTAFVSGAPGGREVEPVRPGRVLIGGIALSVLLMAGAAIAGFLVGRPPAGWLESQSFVISKDTGDQYVVLRGGDDPVIQRVPNYISAQLLLGQSELQPHTVRDKYIRSVQLGEDLGIEAAPAGLPGPDELVSDGWTACTAVETGVKVALQHQPQVTELENQAFMVVSSGRTWLIAPSPGLGGQPGRAYRFELPGNDVAVGVIADTLGFGAEPVKVDREWLNLFPRGAALDRAAFGVTRAGEPARYPDAETDTDFSRYRIGNLLVSDSGHYLLGDEGPQQLDPFAAMVYDAAVERQIPVEGGVRAAWATPTYPEEWPSTVPTPAPAGPWCAVLHPAPDAAPHVALAHMPEGDAAPDDIESGTFEVDVDPSGGAYVLSGSDQSAAGGSPFVIDTKGEKYALIGPEVPGYIGYGAVAPPVVPNAWLAFFEPGVTLSTEAARRVAADAPPESEEEAE